MSSALAYSGCLRRASRHLDHYGCRTVLSTSQRAACAKQKGCLSVFSIELTLNSTALPDQTV
eukprot:3852062-Amphidinium_carterae.1